MNPFPGLGMRQGAICLQQDPVSNLHCDPSEFCHINSRVLDDLLPI